MLKSVTPLQVPVENLEITIEPHGICPAVCHEWLSQAGAMTVSWSAQLAQK
jgi:hypothetical protein